MEGPGLRKISKSRHTYKPIYFWHQPKTLYSNNDKVSKVTYKYPIIKSSAFAKARVMEGWTFWKNSKFLEKQKFSHFRGGTRANIFLYYCREFCAEQLSPWSSPAIRHVWMNLRPFSVTDAPEKNIEIFKLLKFLK